MPTGKEIVALARTHIGQKYVLGAQAPKDNPSYAGPWDCSEFASWLVYQLSRRLYGCVDNGAPPSTANAFTGAWGRDAAETGTKISIAEAARTAGAFLLRVPGSGGIRIGHVVVSDGAGGSIEAHSTKCGVIAGTLANRRWDFGILIPWFTYAPGPAVAVSEPAMPVYRLTDPLVSGPDVRRIQESLQRSGFDPGTIDGMYGSRTMTAVAAFQRAHGLVVDGEVGPVTAAALAPWAPAA